MHSAENLRGVCIHSYIFYRQTSGLVRNSKVFLCNFFSQPHPAPNKYSFTVVPREIKNKNMALQQDSGPREKRTINVNLVCFQIHFILFCSTAIFFGGYQVVEQRPFLDRRWRSSLFVFY